MAAAGASGGIQIMGIKQVRKSLKQLSEAETLNDVRLAMKEGAALVADDARGRVPSKSGAAAGSISSGVSGNRTYVVGGKGKIRYFGWLDFGTRTPRKGNSRAEGPWRGSGKGPKKGRFIYPAIDAKIGEVRALIDAGLNKAIKKVMG